MQRFQALDSFRGLFALAVVIYHCHALQTFTELRFFRNADYFVDFFFVLSGFVLCHTYAQRLGNWAQVQAFAVTRTLRLYPLHLAMLALAIGVECLRLLLERHGMGFGSPAFSGPRAVSEILPNLLLLQAWWSGFDPLSFNYPAWSISIEYYLYLVFALIMLWLPGQTRVVFAGIALIALVALTLHSSLVTKAVWQGLGCFFAGASTYQVYQALQQKTLGPRVATLLEGLTLSAVVLALGLLASPVEVLMCGLFCLTVLVFAFDSGALSNLLGMRPFRWLGTLSYSIYMTHAGLLFMVSAVLLLVGKLTGEPLLIERVVNQAGLTSRFISTGSAVLNNALVIAQLLAVLMISRLSYRYIELPGIAAGKRWAQRRSTLAPANVG